LRAVCFGESVCCDAAAGMTGVVVPENEDKKNTQNLTLLEN